jgi:uncharacterized protein involved in high-affinity Fe2+ transport
MALLLSRTVVAREYFVGGPVHGHDMEIVANYLVGVEMAPMSAGMPMGSDVIHLEADVHATADKQLRLSEWRLGGISRHFLHDREVRNGLEGERNAGPMVARDGPHYADNVRMDGPGSYGATYLMSPGTDGFLRHVDKETGVPDWWGPFSETFASAYPQK